MDIANVLHSLGLDKVSDDWVESIWDGEFYNVDDIPVELEEHLYTVDIFSILNETIASIRPLLKEEPSRVNSSPNSLSSRESDVSPLTWQSLITNNIKLRPLLPILVYFIKTGQENIGDEQLLQRCLKATSLYFLLLAIPGSNAFFVFHPTVYEKALDTLKLGSAVSKTNKSKRSKSKPTQYDNEVDEENCEDNGQDLSRKGKEQLIRGVNAVLKDFLLMAGKFPLRMDDALQKTVVCLVELTQLEVDSAVFNLNRFRTDTSESSLSYNAYIVLVGLCNQIHGQVAVTVKLILWHLLPNVLMVGHFTSGISFSQLCTIRGHTIHFVQFLLIAVKDESYRGILIFLQHLCTKITDKADYRQKGAESVVDIIRVLPAEPYFSTIKWLLKFAHDEKAYHRLFALEVISKLLYEQERERILPEECENELQNGAVPLSDKDSDNDEEIINSNATDHQSPKAPQDILSHRYFLGVLFARCLDVAGAVKTKALSTLSDCMKSNNAILRSLMKEIFVDPYAESEIIDNFNIVEKGFLNTKVFLQALGHENHENLDPLPGGKSVVLKMMSLIEDEKVFVRKSALQVLENILKLNRKWMTKKMLEVICRYCRDPSLLVKKQIIQLLTDLLFLYPDDPHLSEMWVESVLPQISNPENKIQEKVLEVLQQLTLDGLMPFDRIRTQVQSLPWSILRLIIDLKKKKFFMKACAIWARNNVFPKNLVQLLKTHIGTSNNVAAWMLLSCVAQYKEIKNPQFVLDYYREMFLDTTADGRFAVVQSLDVLGSCWRSLSDEEQNQACMELLHAVRGMQLGVGLIGPALDVVTIIYQGQASTPESGQKMVAKWAEEILKLCEAFLESDFGNVEQINREEFLRYLVTLGDVAQLCPGRVKHRTAITLMSVLFPERRQNAAVGWKRICKTPGIQAVTVITFGKLCLQDEFLAKNMVPIIGTLLANSTDLAVKLNAINTLSDMCIRYTAMVEPLVPAMCLCLKDSTKEVREGTLVILIRLLQQDYLKLRGPFFFQLLSMLCDSDTTVSQLTNYYVTECLLSKNKHIMYQNIVESIFYFNKYEGHELYTKINQTVEEERVFDLSGPENLADRRTLYRYMCEHMDDEHRMKATYKLCTDILGGIMNNKVSLVGAGLEVVRDAFYVLSCDEIHLHSLSAQSEEESVVGEAERVTAALTTIKKTIISQCVKKQVVEITVPILIHLKHKHNEEKTQVGDELMAYMRDLLKDYKNEIQEIFSNDKTLAEEILFDIQKARKDNRSNESDVEEDENENGPGIRDFLPDGLLELVASNVRANSIGGASGREDESTEMRRSSRLSGLGKGDSPETNSPEERNADDCNKSTEKRKSGTNSTADEHSSPSDKRRSGNKAKEGSPLEGKRKSKNVNASDCSDSAENRRSSDTTRNGGSSIETSSSPDESSGSTKKRKSSSVSLAEEKRNSSSESPEDKREGKGRSPERRSRSSSLAQGSLSPKENRSGRVPSSLTEKRSSKQKDNKGDKRSSTDSEPATSSTEADLIGNLCSNISEKMKVNEIVPTPTSSKRRLKKRSIDQMSEDSDTDQSLVSNTTSTSSRSSSRQHSRRKNLK